MTSPRTRSRRWSFRPTAAPSRSRRTQKPSFRSCAASRSRPSSRCARQLEETKENYRVMLARSQQESQEMARRAGEVIGEIDRISASLGKNTTEKSKNGLRDVLNSLRPKTEEN